MARRMTTAAIVAFISALAALVYSRFGALYLLYANGPGRLEREIHIRNPVVRFAEVVRNCEDAYLNEDEGWALLSCDPGRDTWNTVMGTFIDPSAPPETGLYLWNYGTDPDSAPEQLKLLDFPTASTDFHPIGIEYIPSSQTLLVVNHAEFGSCVEVFRLFGAETSATYIRTLRHPLIRAPNAIAALSETEFLFTNDHYFLRRYTPLLNNVETYGGLELGSVGFVDFSEKDLKVEILARLSFPNGIVLLNATTAVVASSTEPSITFFTLSREEETNGVKLTKTRTIHLKYHVDNLSVDANGRLLLAGHPHAPSLEAVAKNNRFCPEGGRARVGNAAEKCVAIPWPPSFIQEWSETSGLRTLYLADGLSTICTAARDMGRGLGMAVGLYGRGVLTWEETA